MKNMMSRTFRFAAALSIVAIQAVASEAEPKAAPKSEPKVKERRMVVVSGDRILELDGPRHPHAARGGFLGVSTMELSAELREHFGVAKDTGVLVSRVSDDTPASRAGIRAGDIITEIDGKKIRTLADVSRAISPKKDNETARIEVVRNKVPQQLVATVTVKERDVLTYRFRTPEGREIVGPEAIEAMEHARKVMGAPEVRERIMKIEDCAKVQQRIRDLETRLKEMEKRLQK
jgi:membrane-associated protease RseP (regulator of RpoE activity)